METASFHPDAGRLAEAESSCTLGRADHILVKGKQLFLLQTTIYFCCTFKNKSWIIASSMLAATGVKRDEVMYDV
jgi:hypothetical protein